MHHVTRVLAAAICLCLLTSCGANPLNSGLSTTAKKTRDQKTTKGTTQSDLAKRGTALVLLQLEVRRHTMMGRTEVLPGTVHLTGPPKKQSGNNSWSPGIAELILAPPDKPKNGTSKFLTIREIPAGTYWLTSVTSEKYIWRGKEDDTDLQKASFGAFTVAAGEVRNLGILKLWTNSLWDLGVRIAKTARFEVAKNTKQAKKLLRAKYPNLVDHLASNPITLTRRATKEPAKPENTPVNTNEISSQPQTMRTTRR